MEEELMHELSAAYALDALDADEAREFEAHLARCARCREDVAAFSEAAAALAYAAPAAEPPAALREQILATARAERANVVPLRPRWAAPAAAAAAVAACVAIGLGVWAATLHRQTGPLEALSLQGARGSVVVSRDGQAVLTVAGLRAAPAGKTYELWVIHGKTAAPAGLFAAGSGTTTVRLARRVGHGDVVGVTVEPAGGSPQPTRAPLVTSSPA